MPPTVAGAWFWANRSVGPQGDLQFEQEEWALDVEKNNIAGFYDRTVMLLSSDGRPFRCNGEISFTRRTRYAVEGKVQGTKIELRETDYDVEPGPCESGVRMLDAYQGTVSRSQLVLRWTGGEQVLQRRATPRSGPQESLDLTGTWAWEHRAVDANGDRRVQAEEWSIVRSANALRGSYTSVVTITSGSKAPFACNGAHEYATRARFEFTGHLEDRRVRLRETGYTVEPTPCDRGLRRLSNYSGTFDGEALVLDWGSGRQTLRRR